MLERKLITSHRFLMRKLIAGKGKLSSGREFFNGSEMGYFVFMGWFSEAQVIYQEWFVEWQKWGMWTQNKGEKGKHSFFIHT